MDSSDLPARILPPPPYQLDPEFLQRHVRAARLQLLGAVVSTLGWMFMNSRDRVLAQESRMGMLPFALAVVLYVLWWRNLRFIQVSKAAGTGGLEAVCRVISVTPLKTLLRAVIAHDYTIELPPHDGQPGPRVKVPFPTKAEPLYLRNEYVLALVVENLPKYPLLLHRNLWPLRLGDEQLRQVAVRLQQADPDAQWRVMETSRGPRLLAERGRRQMLGGERWRTERG